MEKVGVCFLGPVLQTSVPALPSVEVGKARLGLQQAGKLSASRETALSPELVTQPLRLIHSQKGRSPGGLIMQSNPAGINKTSSAQ